MNLPLILPYGLRSGILKKRTPKKMVSLRHGLTLGKKGVISLVGAGGKTSLMFRLAHELSASGETVLTTTTTKILRPTAEQSSHLIISDSPAEILSRAGSIIKYSPHLSAIANISSSTEKRIGLPSETIKILWNSHLFRWIIVEADGAARRPLKAPALHEPVIPHCTSLVVGVLGLSALGKPLDDETVFRPELVSKISGLERGMDIVGDTLGALLTHRQGIFKGTPVAAQKIAFLNQADIPGLKEIGHGLIESLVMKKGIDLSRVIIGSTWRDPAVFEYQDINLL